MNAYNHKKVAIVGVSVEGIDSAKFFLSRGAKVTLFDRRPLAELGDAAQMLLHEGALFIGGVEYLSSLPEYDVVVRSPGVSPRETVFEFVRKQGGVVTSQTQVFLEECRAKIIGVTGTKGKGTTSTLISKMLEADGRTVYLGGNVGVPLLSHVDAITPNDWVVLELSSFQLEDVTIAPTIAVVLRITQDHLANYDALASNFHPTREDYVNAKTSIARYQKKTDILIVNADDQTSSSFAQLSKGHIKKFSVSGKSVDAYVKNDSVYALVGGEQHEICSHSTIKLRGRHNLENIAAATLAALSAGASVESIMQASREFSGLHHRLELAGTPGGISYFNDSFSTVPETAIAALQAFSEPVILIAGGSEKGSDFTELGREIAKRDVPVLILIGAMTGRIRDAALRAGYQGDIIDTCTTMHEVVTTAAVKAKAGYVVLMSPACASFGMFKNYKERGAQFMYEVAQLTQ